MDDIVKPKLEQPSSVVHQVAVFAEKENLILFLYRKATEIKEAGYRQKLCCVNGGKFISIFSNKMQPDIYFFPPKFLTYVSFQLFSLYLSLATQISGLVQHHKTMNETNVKYKVEVSKLKELVEKADKRAYTSVQYFRNNFFLIFGHSKVSSLDLVIY